MTASATIGPPRTAVREQLERALAESTEPEVRYHIRQALQMVV
jgi:hypothetical protein